MDCFLWVSSPFFPIWRLTKPIKNWAVKKDHLEHLSYLTSNLLLGYFSIDRSLIASLGNIICEIPFFIKNNMMSSSYRKYTDMQKIGVFRELPYSLGVWPMVILFHRRRKRWVILLPQEGSIYLQIKWPYSMSLRG